ncbi:hypothetical protein N7510_004417 [Penicillium lagena]|uniref:uncharacterized protein n=1 Tax=Penicillium lagena TaxID=94218 RepID=UPI002540F484|nr:uncharacterized protein N7510_004417 [Penicillium lagena]KAJ5620433.1 hypothetical protein N7510_004417 [Penicillium lagena]
MSSPHLHLPIWVFAIFANLYLPLIFALPSHQPFLPVLDPSGTPVSASLYAPFSYNELNKRALQKRDEPENPKFYRYARQRSNSYYYYDISSSLTAYKKNEYIAYVEISKPIVAGGQGEVSYARVNYYNGQSEFKGVVKETEGAEALSKAELQRIVLQDEKEASDDSTIRVPWIQELLWVPEVPEEYSAQTVVVMKKLDGELSSLLRNNDNYDETFAVLELLRGIRDIHASGVIHRDLNPNNVMFERDSAGKLAWYVIDFDYAINFNDLDQSPNWMYPIGTPTYAPPDWPNRQQRDLLPAIDVWLLARTHYDILNPGFRSAKSDDGGSLSKEIMDYINGLVLKFRVPAGGNLREELDDHKDEVYQNLMSGFDSSKTIDERLEEEVKIIAEMFVPQSYRPGVAQYYKRYCGMLTEYTNLEVICPDSKDARWINRLNYKDVSMYNVACI